MSQTVRRRHRDPSRIRRTRSARSGSVPGLPARQARAAFTLIRGPECVPPDRAPAHRHFRAGGVEQRVNTVDATTCRLPLRRPCDARDTETMVDVDKTTDLTHLTASELADAIRAGEVTAAEVVEAHIARVEAVNPSLNALVIPLFDEARDEALARDQAQKDGAPLGALHGVPVTIKEQFRVTGTQTTLGASEKIGKRRTRRRPTGRRSPPRRCRHPRQDQHHADARRMGE